MKRIYLMIREGIAISEDIIAFLKTQFEIMQNPAEAEVIIVCGGDGMMFRASRQYRKFGVPFFGLNYGHIGFLLNRATLEVLEELFRGEVEIISQKMLKAVVYDKDNKEITTVYAFNDFYFERTSLQTARIRISVNGQVLFDPLICNGVVVATAAGSTAYSASAGGIILPVGTDSMVLTGICPHIFHYWRTSELPENSLVTLKAIDTEWRPVVFVAEGEVIPGAVKTEISYSNEVVRLMFAKSEKFREKVNGLLSMKTDEKREVICN